MQNPMHDRHRGMRVHGPGVRYSGKFRLAEGQSDSPGLVLGFAG